MKTEKDIMIAKKVFQIKNTISAFNSNERIAVKTHISYKLWHLINSREVMLN